MRSLARELDLGYMLCAMCVGTHKFRGYERRMGQVTAELMKRGIKNRRRADDGVFVFGKAHPTCTYSVNRSPLGCCIVPRPTGC